MVAVPVRPSLMCLGDNSGVTSWLWYTLYSKALSGTITPVVEQTKSSVCTLHRAKTIDV